MAPTYSPRESANYLILKVPEKKDAVGLAASEVYSKQSFVLPNRAIFKLRYMVDAPKSKDGLDQVAAFLVDDWHSWSGEELGLVGNFDTDASNSTRGYIQYQSLGKQFFRSNDDIEYCGTEWHDYTASYRWYGECEAVHHAVDGLEFWTYVLPGAFMHNKSFRIVLTVHHESDLVWDKPAVFRIADVGLYEVL